MPLLITFNTIEKDMSYARLWRETFIYYRPLLKIGDTCVVNAIK